MYSGNVGEEYVETRVRMYKNLKKKSSMSLPPDPDSVIQVIKRAHLQAFIWYNCDRPFIENLKLEENGWKIENNDITPIWFIGRQLPRFPSKRRDKISKEFTETERECSEKEEVMQPPKKKTRKKRSPIRKFNETETSNMLKETLNNEPTCSGEEGDIERTDDTSTVIESNNESEWEVSDFSSSDDSSDEWLL